MVLTSARRRVCFLVTSCERGTKAGRMPSGAAYTLLAIRPACAWECVVGVFVSYSSRDRLALDNLVAALRRTQFAGLGG